MEWQGLQENLNRKACQLALKRGCDVAGAIVAIFLLVPVFAVVTLLVRLSSAGPIFFRQPRVGYGGKIFTIYKFRTMRKTETDPHTATAGAQAAAAGLLVKGKADPRVTFVGKWLRATSLDELPQLWNVVRGDMSLVGPRPLLPFMLAPHPEFSRVRALARPGITGLWQVSERENNTSARAMMPYDLEYIRQFSLRLDATILLRTPLVVLFGIGAC
jgi:lipopolysaccharide/colanic/teichoic acid biosynthesis glycosyltransferase